MRAILSGRRNLEDGGAGAGGAAALEDGPRGCGGGALDGALRDSASHVIGIAGLPRPPHWRLERMGRCSARRWCFCAVKGAAVAIHSMAGPQWGAGVSRPSADGGGARPG